MKTRRHQQIVAALGRAGRHDLVRVVRATEIQNQIIQFFRDNPNPPDSKVHELAESLDIDAHELEAAIYRLLSQLLAQQ
jgi:hypothetical protein